MKQSWQHYENAAEKGPLTLFFKAFFVICIIIAAIWGAGTLFGWFGEAASVAREEFGPRQALEKYEWFIDQANRIEKMDKDIALFKQRLEGVDEQYAGYGEDRASWPPHIQVQYNRERQQTREDLLAVTSQHNSLVREYNANSEKFNWAPFQTNPNKPKERFREYAVK